MNTTFEMLCANTPIDLGNIKIDYEFPVTVNEKMKITRDVCDREAIVNNEIDELLKPLKYKSAFTEKMLQMCGNDPFAIPEHSREYNEYEVVTDDYQPMDPVFEMLFRPLEDPHFIPNPELEELDRKLEEICANPRSGHRDDSSEEDIIVFAHKYGVSMEEAFEVMRRCHCCGNKNLALGNDYCSGQCIELCEEQLHKCFMGDNCVICMSNGITSMARCFECSCGLEYDEGVVVSDQVGNETLVCRICLDDHLEKNYGKDYKYIE